MNAGLNNWIAGGNMLLRCKDREIAIAFHDLSEFSQGAAQ